MTREATAAIATASTDGFKLDTITLDSLRTDEVLVRIVASGLCHTDLSSKSGRTPFPLPAVLGHEGAGIVAEVGADVRTVAPGDHVIVSFSSCGTCRMCRREDPSNCLEWGARNLISGTRFDGSATAQWQGKPVNANYFGQSSFSELALTRESNVVKVASELPLPLLASLGCGIQTGVGTVLNVLKPEPDDSLIIFGAGAVGLAAVMGAAIAGVKTIVAVDRVPARLDVARACGATEVVLAGGEGPDPLEISGGAGFDHVIEATGHSAVLEAAMEVLAPAGTCAVVGAPAVGTKVSVDVKKLMRGRRLIGVTQGGSNPRTMIPQLVEFHQLGRLPLEQITTFYPFAQINEAEQDAISGKTIKAVLVFPVTSQEEAPRLTARA